MLHCATCGTMLYGAAAAGEVERQQDLWEAKVKETALLAKAKQKAEAARVVRTPRFLGAAPVTAILTGAILEKLQSESNLVQLKAREGKPPVPSRQGVSRQVQ